MRSLGAAERVKASGTKYLTTQLKLVVNEQKSRVARTDECTFLGFTFRGAKLRWSDRSFADFQHRVRRRIRMCYWKQWRWARTKVRNLLALGTDLSEAKRTATSRKGYWHLSKTLATQTGLTNAWLKSQGLLSVRDLWLKAHGYA